MRKFITSLNDARLWIESVFGSVLFFALLAVSAIIVLASIS